MGSYWKGVLVGVAICAVCFFLLKSILGQTPTALVFEPSLIAASEQWILPDATREFTVRLKNLASERARIDDLRFSCPCARGTLAGVDRFPVWIPAGDSVPVVIAVSSLKGERGPLELRFGVVGQIGEKSVEAAGIAAIRFVQNLNATPAFLSLGEVERGSGMRTETVTLWSPSGVQPPADLMVESEAPYISVERRSVSGDSLGQVGHHALAELRISIDPDAAPDRLRADVLVRTSSDELRIPILGFVAQPKVSE